MRSGPLVLHVGLGLAALFVLVLAHYAARPGESYTLFFIPPTLVVWLLLVLVVGLLAKQRRPLGLSAWLVPSMFPPLAVGISLAFILLLD